MAIPRNLANIAPHVNASSTELVVNDGGANLDFRVESDTNANMFFVDGGANLVAVGTNTPASATGTALVVHGGASAPRIRLTNDTTGQASSDGSEFSLDGANLYIENRDAGATIFYASSERLRINAGSNILCLAGGNTSATGTGIAFPATQSASTDANTLDDYEEGTWTPTVFGTPTNMTSVVGVDGKYVKIGKLIYCEANFTGSITSSTAETEITFALPLSRSGSQMVGAVSLVIGSGADRFGVGVISDGGVSTSRQSMYIAGNQVNSTGSVGWLRFSLTYTV